MIERIQVGSQGLVSSRIGLGCMGMSEFYIGSTERECERALVTAVERGITMFDTADMYGPFTNERFVARSLHPYRNVVTIATKFGYVRRSDGTRLGLNGSPAYVKIACDASLSRLRTDCIDLYYLHRVDRNVPVEDTVNAMAELVAQGKVRFIGLSEVSASTLQRAHNIFPISAVQNEFSLASREPEFELFATLRQLGVGFVGYAPLGRGLLASRFGTINDIPLDDYRRTTPRFYAENLEHNMKLVGHLRDMAARLGVTPAQLALAWASRKIDRGAILVGTTSNVRLTENIESLRFQLSDEDSEILDRLFYPGAIHGARYPDMSRVNG